LICPIVVWFWVKLKRRYQVKNCWRIQTEMVKRTSFWTASNHSEARGFIKNKVCLSRGISQITHFFKNQFVKIPKDDQKLVENHLVKISKAFWYLTNGVTYETQKAVGAGRVLEVLGDERTDWGGLQKY